MGRHVTALLLALGLQACAPEPSEITADRDADLIVVGAGISGLSAALEVARGGGTALVLDISSVFGGHAVMAHGGVSIVDSPLQRSLGIEDATDLAYRDFIEWGEDNDRQWVRYYVDNSREQIYDWMTAMGVHFHGLLHFPGNSVLRFHEPTGRGLGLVTPLYLECLRSGRVAFRWNTRGEELLLEDGRVVGVRARNVRSQEISDFRGAAVLVASGGFQSNLQRVRRNWNPELRFPERILAGSGWNSQGSGLDLAAEVGSGFHRLDHQWNYVTGLPDPRYEEGVRGINVLYTDSLWVNAEGKRFVNECLSDKYTLPALLRQPGGSHWWILDRRGRESFRVSGSGWTKEKIDKLIFADPDLVEEAAELEDLAVQAGLPPNALKRTVDGFNRFVQNGEDADFQRFRPGHESDDPCAKVQPISKPPFYAIRMYPLARKSMGGIRVDRQSRALDEQGRVIPGLLAAGEASGLAGINGRAGLEGTFLGPSIVTGRVAGRTLLAELGWKAELSPVSQPAVDSDPPDPGLAESSDAICSACHGLEELLEEERTGYLHFELSHGVVRERGLSCVSCHSELFPYDEDRHRTDAVRRAGTCQICHGI